MQIITNLWNAEQSIREKLGLQPKYCWCKPKSDYACKPNETFQCNICNRFMPYCRGAADNMPAACDDCWEEPNSNTLKVLKWL